MTAFKRSRFAQSTIVKAFLITIKKGIIKSKYIIVCHSHSKKSNQLSSLKVLKERGKLLGEKIYSFDEAVTIGASEIESVTKEIASGVNEISSKSEEMMSVGRSEASVTKETASSTDEIASLSDEMSSEG